MHFLVRKLLNFNDKIIEICSLGSNWQYVSIGSDNGLVLPLSEPIMVWFTDAYVRYLASMSWMSEVTWYEIGTFLVLHLVIVSYLSMKLH